MGVRPGAGRGSGNRAPEQVIRPVETLLVATRSPHKLAEIRRILSPLRGLDLLDPEEAGIGYDPEEDGLEPFDGFEKNACSKARYFARRSGLPTVADDSGLVVDALDGAPGVHSKRFALEPGLSGQSLDDANTQRLLKRLRGVPPKRRTARYVCIAALAVEGEDLLVVSGTAEGVILTRPRGRGGFGYDPVFLDSELGTSFAEISGLEKDRRSHRGKAFRQLARYLGRGSALGDPLGPGTTKEDEGDLC